MEIATPAIMLLVIELNGVPFSEWKYGLLLFLFLLFAIGGADYWKYYKRGELRCIIKKSILMY